MKYSTLLVGALLIFLGCDSVGSTEQLSPEELIQGSWQVSFATIDGEVYPVTVPGLGQIQAIFNENNVEYTYPAVDENGLPTGQTDTLNGDWSFNDEHSRLIISNIGNGIVSEMEWVIVNIGVGLLQTSYEGPSAFNPALTSTYEITYRLIE